MKETEFNLIDEPWIKVMEPNGEVKEVSLLSALLDADKYTDLAGETETQNVAVLRLLLAIMHAVFYRVNESGEEEPLEEDDIDLALERWKALWDMKAMPKKPVTDYLEKWRDRFWLFHPERPFYQSLSAKEGTYNSAAKLIGELSKSGNKERLFQARGLEGKESVAYPEAARWLVYINGFDDAALKPHIQKEQRESKISVAWLGQLGLVLAKGKTLYETLLLNFIIAKNDDTLWSDEPPVWELDKAPEQELRSVPLPQSQMSLLTLQSRRVLLERKNGAVSGYGILCGDSFESENAFAEQMTAWSYRKGKSGVPACYTPKAHYPGRQMWRDFAGLFMPGEERKLPGVVEWVSRLGKNGYISQRLISFASSGNRYDSSQRSAVTDILGDGLTFHTGLLDKIDGPWTIRVNEEVEKCDKAAREIWILAQGILEASGGSDSQNSDFAGKYEQQWYDRVDMPFRGWLLSLDPKGEESPREAGERWHKSAKSIALALAGEMVSWASDSAVLGMEKKKDGSDNKVVIYSAAKAHMFFKSKISKLYGRSEN